MDRPITVGISVCFEPPDHTRKVFTGKALQYAERSMVNWVGRTGMLPLLLPSLGEDDRAMAFANLCDALVLHGGADVSPLSYGRTQFDAQWPGDRERDEYELALIHAFLQLGKPVLGICRGMQILNVALGGTLVQDIPTLRGSSVTHRNPLAYDGNVHALRFASSSWMRELHSDDRPRANSIHHQAIDRLAPGLEVHAVCPEDGTIEAVALAGAPFVVGVQWHPEFHRPGLGVLDNDAALMMRLISAAERRRNS